MHLVGFDILVKNCVAHNGAQQRMQLIDSNGCVTNDKLISPFRGTYNGDNGHQVSLFAYLKAFRYGHRKAINQYALFKHYFLFVSDLLVH